ncbi:MAG: DEAD/DEAH box helicase, partial [Candidatus Marsarchaeota archaeon]|nr:DEAD/DEAH box helicase [Candidatus Marsarchaeota archaeon]
MGAARSVFVERIGRLNKLQETAFEVISSKGNCIITAPTGSGKTEAAMLPVLESACSIADLKGVFALYVTPLRALNRDMMKRLGELCGVLGINIAVRHGDTTQNERRKQAETPPHVLITTPESIQN